jgi:hypothetical protein
MVVDADIERPTGLGDPPRRLDVAAAGGGVSRGVVVREDEGGGAHFKRPPHDLAGVDGGLADGAVGVRLVMEQPVAAVQEQDSKPLGRQERHVEREVVDELLGIVQRRARERLGAKRVEHRIANGREKANCRVTVT